MKLKSICLFLLAVFLLSACAPGYINTPTTATSLPDLVVSNVYLEMRDIPTNWTGCITTYGPLEIRALIKNVGQETAHNITVVELSTGTNLIIGELEAGQAMELNFPIASANAAYNVVGDPQNTITESDEENNTHSYFAVTPTPPALCTPTSASLLYIAKK
jgi:subtilase family serine protease